MLSIFPDLLSFGLLAPVLLRVTLGIILIIIGRKIAFKYRGQFFKFYQENKYPVPNTLPLIFGFLTILTGTFMIIGFLTQVAAIIAIYISLSLHLTDKDLHVFEYQKSFYALMVVVSISLLLLGAGIFAIDLPL